MLVLKEDIIIIDTTTIESIHWNLQYGGETEINGNSCGCGTYRRTGNVRGREII